MICTWTAMVPLKSRPSSLQISSFKCNLLCLSIGLDWLFFPGGKLLWASSVWVEFWNVEGEGGDQSETNHFFFFFPSWLRLWAFLRNPPCSLEKWHICCGWDVQNGLLKTGERLCPFLQWSQASRLLWFSERLWKEQCWKPAQTLVWQCEGLHGEERIKTGANEEERAASGQKIKTWKLILLWTSDAFPKTLHSFRIGSMTPAAVSGLLVRRTGLVTVKRCMGRWVTRSTPDSLFHLISCICTALLHGIICGSQLHMLTLRRKGLLLPRSISILSFFLELIVLVALSVAAKDNSKYSCHCFSIGFKVWHAPWGLQAVRPS